MPTCVRADEQRRRRRTVTWCLECTSSGWRPTTHPLARPTLQPCTRPEVLGGHWSLDTSGTVTDRFGAGNNFDALTFAPGNRGFGANLFYYLRRDITGLTVTAPDGAAPHALAQRGYYMMFALNTDGIPSTATWVHLS